MVRPARRGEGLPRLVRIQIGDAENMDTDGRPRLGQEHGAELTGPDQADPHGPIFLGPGDQQVMKIHG